MWRRAFLVSALSYPLATQAQDEPSALKLLREGGVVVALRHALAPGTFDPPEFKLGDCNTQRNLSDEGRSQARLICQWFQGHEIKPARVRSSPWCRCIDTATLAFGRAEAWPALGSPHGGTPNANVRSQRELALAVSAATRQAGRFEVWVTHQFVLSDLVGVATGSGEGLLLRADQSGGVQVVGRLPNF
jgi:phosphohistidine phosphatase SixA